MIKVYDFEFPFLIGRIRTSIFLIYIFEDFLFPFLIGRIRTILQRRSRIVIFSVSIPHR